MDIQLQRKFIHWLQQNWSAESKSIFAKVFGLLPTAHLYYVGGKNLLRLNGNVQNSSFLLSPLNVLNFTHHGIPLSFFDFSTSNVLSRKTATIKPTVAGDENMVFRNALNCKHTKSSIIKYMKPNPQDRSLPKFITQNFTYFGFSDDCCNTYPSCIGMNKTMPRRIPIFVKELGNRNPKEERKPSNNEVSH